MIVWGGWNVLSDFNTGGRYNPTTDSWIQTSTNNAPGARRRQTAVWTGREMIVWGGISLIGHTVYELDTGGKYNPETDSWVATSTTNAPLHRQQHTAVWTGTEMIIWGDILGRLSKFWCKYHPGTDSWIVTSTYPVPAPRHYHTAVWTGNKMIIWAVEIVLH